MKSNRTILISMGDSKGVGPEVIVKALNSKSIKSLMPEFNFLIVGSDKTLAQTAKSLDIKFEPTPLRHSESRFSGAKNLSCDETLPTPRRGQGDSILDGNVSVFEPETKTTNPARLSVEYIIAAIELMKANKGAALVTGPVSKQAIQESGFPFIGHTELLAQKTVSRQVTMMFVAPQLKVSLATTHIAYRKVLLYLTLDKIVSTIEQTDEALRNYFGIAQPRLAVCGLNPHAGEGGKFGNEEAKIIKPAIDFARRRKIKVDGPFAPDSIFNQALKGSYDAVIAMYHDQGLIPIKTLAFAESVQLTLGLPFIRTSPAHGVAYDIAGKGIADPSSMIEALKLACSMAKANSPIL